MNITISINEQPPQQLQVGSVILKDSDETHAGCKEAYERLVQERDCALDDLTKAVEFWRNQCNKADAERISATGAVLKITGWHYPKRGDKVKLIKEPPVSLTNGGWVAIGEVFELEGIAAGSDYDKAGAESMKTDPHAWKRYSTPCAIVKTKSGIEAWIPIDCLAPA